MSGGYTDDTLLGGLVRLRQPKDGYRAAVDPVLLAASVPARRGDRVLDVGSGTGAASLCLAGRVEGCRITGLECDPAAAALARANAEANGMARIVDVILGDLAHPPARLGPASFDHVMTNPPFHAAGSVREPDNLGRTGAHVEGGAGLMCWIRFAAAMVRRGGTVTTIHLAERLDELLAAYCAADVGEIAVVPLRSKDDGRPAHRVILRGRRDIRAPLSLLPGLVLQEADGRYREGVEAILRGPRPLDFVWRRR